MSYTDFNTMYSDFVKKCQSAVEKVVPDVMKDKMSEAVEMEVYGKYSPDLYSRRKSSGGMSDKGNYDYDIDVTNNRITITMYNNTPPSGANNIRFLDVIVVTGNGYNWRNSRIYKNPIARDFYKVTEELLNDGKLRAKLISELNSYGLQVR